MFVVGVVVGFVASYVDVDVGVTGFGVDVIVCVCCLEEVEVGNFTGCDADGVELGSSKSYVEIEVLTVCHLPCSTRRSKRESHARTSSLR